MNICNFCKKEFKYKRDFITYSYPKIINHDSNIEKLDIKNSLIKILSHHNYSNKSWVWEQYDHMVMTDTIQKPGGDSAVVRYHGKNKGIAATFDSNLQALAFMLV